MNKSSLSLIHVNRHHTGAAGHSGFTPRRDGMAMGRALPTGFTPGRAVVAGGTGYTPIKTEAEECVFP